MVFNKKSASLLLLLRPHRNLGYLLLPFLGHYNKDEHEAIIESPVTQGDLKDIDLMEEEKEIVSIAENYSESELLRRFVKRKKGGESLESGFFGSTNREKYERVIRPFIDARLNEVYEKALAINIPVFYKEATDASRKFKQEIHLTEDQIRAEFFFLRHQEGIDYQLKLYDHQQVMDLKNSDVQVVSHHPLILLKDDWLMRISELHAKNLTPFLKKDKVLIPKKFEENYLKSFIRKTIRDFDVSLEGVVLNAIKDQSPKRVLEFTKDFSGFPVLQLKFFYDTIQVSVNDKVRPLVSLQQYEKEGEVVFQKILRNTSTEKEALRELKRSGLKNQRESFFSLVEQAEASETAFVEWINKNVNRLKEKGFEVKQPSNRSEYYIGTVDLNTSAKQDSNDWFDLYMEIQLDGFSFPFVDLVDNLKKGDREFFLKDGRVFIIPEAWFADYIDLLRYSRITRHGFSVSKYHFGLLPENTKVEEEEYDDRLPGGLQDLFLRRFDQLAKDPEALTGSLRDYQRFGLSWLLQLNKLGMGGCLADDMGLGKTIQTIALLLSTQNKDSDNSTAMAQSQLALFDETPLSDFPSLLVMPTSLLYNWKNEFASFAPSLRVLVYSGKREGLTAQFTDYDVILTSYGIMRIDVDILKKFEFHYLIIDESQFVKNPHSKTYKALLELNAQFRMALTGTPVENSLRDLWAQLNFLNRDFLGSFETFQERFVYPVERDNDEEREKSLKQLIHPFILRRRKDEVLRELPDLTEQVYWCEMTEEQENAYERYKSGIRNNLLDVFEEDFSMNKMRILEALLRMRQMANHPKLLEKDFLGGSGKFDEVIRSIENLLSEGHKALLFSSFTGYLDLFASYFDEQQYSYSMITGKTKNREEQVNKFQKDENTRLFLISLKAGGTGLNLTAADYVFILDPWWNPAAENQALSRAHRIGQKNKVFVYRFITRKSIEEKIFGLQKRKQELADTFVNFNNPLKQLTEEELKQLFDFKS